MADSTTGRAQAINPILAGLGGPLWGSAVTRAAQQSAHTINQHRQLTQLQAMGNNPIIPVSSSMSLEQQLAKKAAVLGATKGLAEAREKRQKIREEIRERKQKNHAMTALPGRLVPPPATTPYYPAKEARARRRARYKQNKWNLLRLWFFDLVGVPRYEAIRHTLEHPAPEWMRK